MGKHTYLEEEIKSTCVDVNGWSMVIFLSSPSRFIGYDPEGEELDADKLRHHIYGGHVADYMKHLMEEDEEKYKAHFSRYIKAGVTADSVSH